MDRPLAKDSLTRWTHWAAVIREKESGARFAIDSGTGPNGDNPTMQAAASFYVPDSYADNAPPEKGLATAEHQRGAGARCRWTDRHARAHAEPWAMRMEPTGSAR